MYEIMIVQFGHYYIRAYDEEGVSKATEFAEQRGLSLFGMTYNEREDFYNMWFC